MRSLHSIAGVYFRFGSICLSRNQMLGALQIFSIQFMILTAKFVCAQMIRFARRDRCHFVSVGCRIVKL